MRLYTVGHGTRTTEELVAVLRHAGVDRLVDVRRFPGSRRNPHLSREMLSRDLPLTYEWWGEELGGRRRPAPQSRHPAWRNDAFRAYAEWMDTPVFTRALDRLLSEPTPTAVMCAETLWWRCHRRLIADAATLRGTEVVHLIDVRQSQPHVLHEAVRLDERGGLVYDAGTQAELW
ncbi:MAG TPA: DUF488 domain-containing protein [Acidimicrobiales bacterium]|nr:DUF488 domain-containing protein [Acidimicrobiales bacterium]